MTRWVHFLIRESLSVIGAVDPLASGAVLVTISITTRVISGCVNIYTLL